MSVERVPRRTGGSPIALEHCSQATDYCKDQRSGRQPAPGSRMPSEEECRPEQRTSRPADGRSKLPICVDWANDE
jgi:hypothetical protein